MMGIEEDNPIFIYMKKCPRCVSDNSDLKDDGFFPWLWSVEEKAQEASQAELQARELIADAIVHARCFVNGHSLSVGAARL